MEGHHHIFEFVVIYHHVFVFIEFLYEVTPLLIADFLLATNGPTHYSLKHVDWDLAFVFYVVTQIKKIESMTQVQV